MNATACVVPPAPLFYRHIQMTLSDALERNVQNYDSQVILPTTCREELNWWDTQMCKWNGKSIFKTETDLTINSDASLRGWELVVTSKQQEARGQKRKQGCTSTAWSCGCRSGSPIICQRQNQNFYSAED